MPTWKCHCLQFLPANFLTSNLTSWSALRGPTDSNLASSVMSRHSLSSVNSIHIRHSPGDFGFWTNITGTPHRDVLSLIKPRFSSASTCFVCYCSCTTDNGYAFRFTGFLAPVSISCPPHAPWRQLMPPHITVSHHTMYALRAIWFTYYNFDPLQICAFGGWCFKCWGDMKSGTWNPGDQQNNWGRASYVYCSLPWTWYHDGS